MISSIESIKIMILRILESVPVLGITNIRSLNWAFVIGTTIYVRFGLSRSYRYIRDGVGSFNDICIYLSIFGMIIAKSVSVEMAEKISLR